VHEEIAYLDARELAARIRARELSPVEVLAAFRERAEAINPSLNALVTPMPDAEERSRAAEAAVLRGDELGLLHGVPFTIKDSFDTAGVRTTRGSRLFAEHVPADDAEVVRRLVAAGGIPLAKTNLPDFVLWWETDNLVFGRTVNPWNPERTAGGSSGGEAAAIAAGLSPLGIGSDLGGSIRLPAHYCGVAGLKPTHGRVPGTGHWPETLLRFLHVGFLARSAADIALALALTAGPDGHDPYCMPVPPPEPLDGLQLPPLRIGLVVDAFGPVDPEVRAVVERAGEALSSRGCAVEPADVPALSRHDWNTTTMTLYGGGGGLYFDRVIAGRHDQLHPALRRRLSAPRPSLEDYVAVEEAVEELRLDLPRTFRDHDLLLCTTVPVAAHGHDAAEVEIDGATYPPRTTMRATIPWDVSGSPALTVPFGWSSEGLPIGVQLVGRHFEDRLVLQAGVALEEARGELRRPPL
jgi:Asp-tRNA(Asn)/Glu-tRNA(Gln) amidotransferase A subunit family amidase